ncbi:glucose-1-phosphatase [Mesocricetibacter intestinalis]|uniref:Glucose-1-phosphatase n=1 Tax=Mesocricetibacter intestinalis TaxID=1521930 RepID=A0A4R6V779_9PAST|nr:histidine-type phosphatase [Mesocricetibacter intestinalis]TDQ56672.1 glucose-1-phosphatase [Mesocricetibacter intestinalis]
MQFKSLTKLCCLALGFGVAASAFAVNETESTDYELKELVVLSRHNIRAPLSGNDSELGKITPHSWHQWSAKSSELTSRGGVLEVMQGQYFRKMLEQQGLFKEGACLNKDEILIYANSMQRTVATAEYFQAGLAPTCGLNVIHRFAPSKMDPVFFPRLTKVNDKFTQQALTEINQMLGDNGLEGINRKLAPSYELLEKVTDMKDSSLCRDKQSCTLNTDEATEVKFQLYREPALSGTLKLATRITDALILQYFEQPDDNIASFGEKLSEEDWEKISYVKDVYGDILFSAPIVAANVAYPLLNYLHDEINSEVRKFTFLVGHDSNISSVTAALGVEPYSLPNTIEKKTPIGSKLVFEKWQDKKSKQLYVAVKMVYQSTEQLRAMQSLDLQNPPQIYSLRLQGLQADKQGFYKLEDINARFADAFAAYENIR